MKRFLPIFRNALTLFALIGVILLAAYLRLSNLTDNPGWFADEGSNLDVANHLRQGQLQYMALGQSTLMVSRLILFESFLGTLLTWFSGGITTLRVLTGALGISSVLMVYICTQRLTHKTLLALLAALLLAIYPQAILYSRFGFSYNLLPLLVMPAYVALWEYIRSSRRGWLMLAAVLIGLGTISDVWMLALIAPFGLVALRQRWRDLLWSFPVVLLPFGLYIAFLWSQAPQAMMMDLRFIFFRVSNVPLLGQIQSVALNYTVLLSQDFWMPCAVIGFLLLRPLPLRHLTLLLFFLTLAILGRTIALYSLSAYYMIPLLPFVAFGAAVSVDAGLNYIWSYLHETLVMRSPALSLLLSSGVCLGIVGAPLLVSLGLDLEHVRTGFPTAIDSVLISPTDARQVAQFINKHAAINDLVIVNPAISWLFNTHTADIQMSIAVTGQATVLFPANIPSDRWLFNPRIEQARYVVIDNYWRHWGATNIVDLTALIGQIQTWPTVFQTGDLTVYENPLVSTTHG